MPHRLQFARSGAECFVVRAGGFEGRYDDAREAIVHAVQHVRGSDDHRAEVSSQRPRRLGRPREWRLVTISLGPNGLVAGTGTVFTAHPAEEDADSIAEHVLGHHQWLRCPSSEGPCC